MLAAPSAAAPSLFTPLTFSKHKAELTRHTQHEQHLFPGRPGCPPLPPSRQPKRDSAAMSLAHDLTWVPSPTVPPLSVTPGSPPMPSQCCHDSAGVTDTSTVFLQSRTSGTYRLSPRTRGRPHLVIPAAHAELAAHAVAGGAVVDAYAVLRREAP
ncbi:hypothetical protein P7K49_002268, partial [Saguinus oedipus]